MQDSLQLRFSLVGGMFDTVQRNASTTTEWAILLLQLITYGVIDMNNNPLVPAFRKFNYLINM